MVYLKLIFPVAALGFIALVLSECLPALERPPGAPAAERALTRRDAVAMAVISLVYALAAFTNLGVNAAPQTFCRFAERGQYALVELDEPREIGALMYYSGLYSGSYRLQFSADGETWTDQTAMTQEHGDLFKWQYAELAEDNGETRFVRVVAAERLWLGEIALFDADGERIGAEHLIHDEGCRALFDEPGTVPDEPGYLNSAYFDEIYHARTAYEHTQNIKPYELSHPPLGKLIISLGLRLFGMTPFGWRFMGTLFGVLMLPLMYVFLKKLFGTSSVAGCCTAVFAFDFMHFTQTRIATIDTYAVFFILLMYLFMYLYLRAERGAKKPRRAWLPYLALAGLSFGLGAASKWTCIYAGAGLGLLWLCDRVLRGVRLCRAGKKWHYIYETAENILWCLLFFVIVPATVYYLSYYPYGKAEGLEGAGMFFTREYLGLVLENQRFMFSYHAGVTATHPYSSSWYEWLADARPILYYLKYFGDGTKSSFGAFVSPLLCWGGLCAVICVGLEAVRLRDGKAAFILLGYLTQLLPWVAVPRITFEYHYFPCTVFLTLALGYVFAHPDAPRARRWPLYSFTAVSLLLFAAFYPVLSGMRVPEWYSHNLLAWFPSWPF